MLDHDQPVTFTSNGKRLFHGTARRTIVTIAKTLEKRPLRARKVMGNAEAKMIDLVEKEIEHELDRELRR